MIGVMLQDIVALCLKSSYITMAEETEAFKELILPCIGIEAMI